MAELKEEKVVHRSYEESVMSNNSSTEYQRKEGIRHTKQDKAGEIIGVFKKMIISQRKNTIHDTNDNDTIPSITITKNTFKYKHGALGISTMTLWRIIPMFTTNTTEEAALEMEATANIVTTSGLKISKPVVKDLRPLDKPP